MRPDYGKPTTIRLEPTTREKLREVAERDGATEADTHRRALKAGLRSIARKPTEARSRAR